MSRHVIRISCRSLLLSFLLLSGRCDAENWPGWRGPNRNGVTSDTGVPTTWSATENVLWKMPVPGAGISNPVIWEDRVFVTASEGREQAAQVRCGADDNCSVWLNGEKVFGRDQWLNGTRFDRFVTPIQLKAGRNTLLVKICQGPQHKDPEVPNNWSLQLRLCDAEGRGIEFKPKGPGN